MDQLKTGSCWHKRVERDWERVKGQLEAWRLDLVQNYIIT
jgi:hypothetical protein